MKKISAMLLAVLITFSMFSMNFADAAEKQEAIETSQSAVTEIAASDSECSDVQNVEVASGDADFSDKGTGNIELTDEEREKIPSVSTIAQYKKMAGIPNLKNSAQSVPANVDNSQSKYFPEIGDQNTVGSCCAWADAYYLMSYTKNRSLDRAATYDNSCSPLWVYNAVNHGSDYGSTCYDIHSFAMNYGIASMRTYGNITDFKPLGSTRDAWKDAQDCKEKSYYRITLPDEDTRITSPEDEDLLTMKTAISNGELLTFSTYVFGFEEREIEQNDEVPENSKYLGQYIVPYLSNRNGGHRMTIVGYNDDLWYDINNDGIVDEGEKGAFKIVNSWGTSYANDGFIWISYDTLNKISSVQNNQLNCVRSATVSMNDIVGITFDSESNRSNINFEYTIGTQKRDAIRVTLIADDGTTARELNMYPNDSMAEHYSFDGSFNFSYGTFSIDLSKYISGINSDNLAKYKFSVRFTESDGDNILRIEEAKIVDYNYDTEYCAGFSTKPVEPILKGNSRTFDIAISQGVQIDDADATIYYSGYGTPYIHYQVDGGNWTSAPGYAMSHCNDLSGYTHKYTIPLNGADGATVCFNDGNGNWDSNNGLNYYFESGTYKYANGVKEKITAVDNSKLRIKNVKTNAVEDTIYTDDALEITANGMNGKGPYEYRFGYYENGIATMGKYSSTNTASFKFDSDKKITPVVYIKDSDGVFVSKLLKEITVKKSMDITSLTVGSLTLTEDSSVDIPANVTNSFTLNIINANTSTSYSSTFYKLVTYEIKCLNGSNALSTMSSTNDMSAAFSRCGKYSIVAQVIDYDNKRATFKSEFNVVSQTFKQANIYFATNEKYRVDYLMNGISYSLPSKPSTTFAECPYAVSIDLSQSPQTKVHFVDSKFNILDNNGSHFEITHGDYLYKDGKLISISNTGKPLNVDKLTCSADNNEYLNEFNEGLANFKISGGVAPYKFELYFVKNGEKYLTYSSSSRYDYVSAHNVNLYSVGKYSAYFKVTDVFGNVAEKESDETVDVHGVEIDSFTASVQSPQPVGTEILFITDAFPATYKELVYTIKKDGVIEEQIICENTGCYWTPKKTGKYTITASVYDYHGQCVEQTMDYEIYSTPFKIVDYTTHIYSDSVRVGESYSVDVKTTGGTAPYQYQFGYIHNGKTVTYDYSDSSICNYIHYEGGDYQCFVTVKDAEENSITKMLDVVHVDKLKVTAVNTSLTSPQPAETAIKLSAEYENARSMYGSYGECTFTIKKDNVVTDIFTNSMSITPEWTPTEPGNYTITYYMRDIYGQTDSKTVDYTVTDKLTSNSNIITVFYSGYDTPNIHYMVSPGVWTAVPGVAMTKTDEQSGYTHKYTVDIGENTSFTCCFNDNNNNWDSCNGANYTIDNISGNTVYGIKNGGKNFISQSAVTLSDLAIDTFVNSSDSIGVSKKIDMNVSVSGGTAPYTYQFGYITNGVKHYLNLNYMEIPNNSYSFSIAGKYSTFVNVRDSKGNFVTKTADLTVIDDAIPVEVSSFTAGAGSAKTGDTVNLSAYGKNGTPYYTMKYSYEINGVKTYINEEPTSSYYVEWKPQQAGVYTLFVEMYDINKNKAEAAIYNYVVTDSSDTAYDLNMDGVFDISDITLLQQYLAGTADLTESAVAKADANNDGIVNVCDVTTLQMFLAKK